jgi:hypothetical protein
MTIPKALQVLEKAKIKASRIIMIKDSEDSFIGTVVVEINTKEKANW